VRGHWTPTGAEPVDGWMDGEAHSFKNNFLVSKGLDSTAVTYEAQHGQNS